MTTRTRRLLVTGAAVLMGAAAMAGCGTGDTASAAGDDDDTDLRTVSVSGIGQADVVPDLVELRTNVHTQGPDASSALTLDNGVMRAVLDAAKAAGVADADIQTANVSVFAVFTGDDPPRPNGYGADHSLVIRIHDVAAAGPIVDAVMAAGGGSIRLDSLRPLVDDPHKGLEEARKAAVADARSKAEAMAAASGAGVGPVRSIVEGVGPHPFDQSAGTRLSKDVSSFAELAVSPGTDEQTVQVTIVFDLV
jgi:uncharacterized protein YggE